MPACGYDFYLLVLRPRWKGKEETALLLSVEMSIKSKWIFLIKQTELKANAKKF